MNSLGYIRKRQILWAERQGLALVFRKSQKTYTECENANLFEHSQLTEPMINEYRDADGQELTTEKEIGNMRAVYSSSALVVNALSYWRRRETYELITDALGINIVKPTVKFERQLPVSSSGRFPKNPNLDVTFEDESSFTIIGIESKLQEPYSGNHGGIKEAYLSHDELWASWSVKLNRYEFTLPALDATKSLAKAISPGDNKFIHLHAAQLIKHLLGLRNRYKFLFEKAIAEGNRPLHPNIRLLYLWYDVPYDEGAMHRDEIERFAKILKKDGVHFQSLTWQELIMNLAEKLQDKPEHRDYINYLVERYL